MKNSNSLRRQDHIMKLLAKEARMSIHQLASLLDVSGWTIRRDLAQLERCKLVQRSYGAVERVASDEARFYVQSKQGQDDPSIMEAKKRIGTRAAGLLQSGTQVAMGAGATTLACAQHLKHHQGHLLIMTNGLNIALELTGLPSISLVCTGGTAHEDFFTLTGPVAERAIKSHYFDVALIGVGGISVGSGITVDSYLNAAILEAMIRNAQWVIVLADHSKFERARFAHLADLSAVDVVVTDQTPQACTVEDFAARGIKIEIAE